MSDALSPYAELYANPSGPGDQRPTALQVVEDSGAKGTRTGRVVLVTGGTAGIGVETVRAMHSTGADVYFTARSLEMAAATTEDMDLDSLDSVRKAARDFLTINILVNNAGTNHGLLHSRRADDAVATQMMSPPQGAATSVWAAVAKACEGNGGKYLAHCGVAGTADAAASILDPGAAPHAYDLDGEDRLWELSAKLVGLEKDV
ncbi:NAD(P)-binding domain protein [Metarhizium album ARSEF 1941]|uniref:NAD(P)-binding domain protein n=1 Tax=Metarhizium album (strain ARSEF 1941) TaxID=1081103 RepID=A0A0B2X1Y3_METAS|nr:NAD(P)-binding domain protein [Metarhizium album ARSEF 1941]KHN99165.1 NAD(P)-binding domain protein [Metarhizium album ARSEF 1941]